MEKIAKIGVALIVVIGISTTTVHADPSQIQIEGENKTDASYLQLDYCDSQYPKESEAIEYAECMGELDADGIPGSYEPESYR